MAIEITADQLVADLKAAMAEPPAVQPATKSTKSYLMIHKVPAARLGDVLFGLRRRGLSAEAYPADFEADRYDLVVT